METQLKGLSAPRYWVRWTACALLLVALASSPWASADPLVVPISEASAHVGETVVVEGRVADVFTSKKGNTFLNFGARYPNQTFSAVIFVSEASLFPNVHALEGRKVRVSGRITLYEGKPQIILKEASQLRAL
jgi:DNA/RNA endonuclease YhcR with UshA esterase domain